MKLQVALIYCTTGGEEIIVARTSDEEVINAPSLLSLARQKKRRRCGRSSTMDVMSWHLRTLSGLRCFWSSATRRIKPQRERHKNKKEEQGMTRKEKLLASGKEILWERGDDELFLIQDGGDFWFVNFYENNEGERMVDEFYIDDPDDFDQKHLISSTVPDNTETEKEFWKELKGRTGGRW